MRGKLWAWLAIFLLATLWAGNVQAQRGERMPPSAGMPQPAGASQPAKAEQLFALANSTLP